MTLLILVEKGRSMSFVLIRLRGLSGRLLIYRARVGLLHCAAIDRRLCGAHREV